MVRSCYGTYCHNLERTRNHSQGWGHVAWNGKTHGLLAKNGCGIMEKQRHPHQFPGSVAVTKRRSW